MANEPLFSAWCARAGIRPFFVAGLILVAVTAAIYLPICAHGFVTLDDRLHLHDNPHFNPPSLFGLWNLWRSPYAREYVPLTYTFYFLEAWIGRLPPEEYGGARWDPAVFHAGSVFLHALTTLGVFLLLARLLGDTLAAMIGALAFSLHPLQVEAVAWISETRGLLAGMLSVFALDRYVAFASTDARRWQNYAAATALFLLALLAKSSAAAAPLIALILDVGLLRRPWRAALLSLAPAMVFVAAFAVLMKGQQTDRALELVPPVWARPLIAADALTFYFWKVLAPFQLAVHYPRDVTTVMSSPWLFAAWVLPALIGAGLYLVRPVRFLWPAVAVFVAGVAPVLGLLPFAFQDWSTVADRYVYLAMSGVALGIAATLARHPSRGLAAGCVALVIFWGLVSYAQSKHWQDSHALNRRALEVNPRSTYTLSNLITDCLREGDYLNALQYSERLLKIKRTHDGLFRQALALSGLGRTDEAASVYEQILEESPEYSLARMNLAVLLYRQGRVEQAIEEYRRVLRTSPDDAVAHRKLGGVLAVEGQLDEGIAHLTRAVEIKPKSPEAHAELATALAIDDQPRKAIDHYRTALGLGPPDWPLIANRLAHLLATHPDPAVRDGPEALRLAQAACHQFNYTAPELLQTLAAALAELSQFDEARKVTDQALTLARQQDKQTLVAELDRNQALYQERRPWRVHPRDRQARESDAAKPPAAPGS